MKVTVRILYLDDENKEPVLLSLSRVPCIGEFVPVEGNYYEVLDVYHVTDSAHVAEIGIKIHEEKDN